MALKISFPHEHKNWTSLKSSLEGLTIVSDLEDAFRHLAHIHYAFHDEPKSDKISKTPFHNLKLFIEQKASEEERESFLKESLPTIARLVLDMPSIAPETPLTIVKQQEAVDISLSRHFVASIVATGFLCLYEDLEEKHNLSMPTATFTYLFGLSVSNQAKLRMFLNYFRRISKDIPKGSIRYQRIVLGEAEKLTIPKLVESSNELCPIVVNCFEKIEDAGKNVLQIDFANEYLGGGVLWSGCVQEEIRFSICPELISSMLFMESMAPNEAVVIQGFEQFSSYVGYGFKLKYSGDYDDSASKNEEGDILTTLSAIDAVEYGSFGNIEQFLPPALERDLTKAYAGFLQPYAKPLAVIPETTSPEWLFNLDPNFKRTIATGNWGCGAFGGIAELKSLLQWVAASEAKSPALVYYTFQDPNIEGLESMVTLIESRHWSVGDLMTKVSKYCAELIEKEDEMNCTLFEYLSTEEMDVDKNGQTASTSETVEMKSCETD